jgi:putative tricarboxylic transport membrane protein
LLLPVTYQLDPAGSLIMFAGIYYGGMYGGSTTSILLNTPGESASIVTALEGNKMARAGRGGPALATAAIGSFVAGLIATLGLAFIAPFIVKLALVLRAARIFRADGAGLRHRLVGLRRFDAARPDSLFIGLALGLIGIDQQTGQARLSFGIPDLLDGVEVTTLAVAMFAIGETLYIAARARASARRSRRSRVRSG